MVKSESGRGGRGRTTGRARTPGQSRPVARRPRIRSAAPVEDAAPVAVIDEPQVVSAEQESSSFRLPKVFERIAAVNARRALVLLGVLALLALTLAVPTRTYLSQRAEFDRLQEANAELEREVDYYQKRVTEQNDPAWIENQARARLQFVMPGEKQVVLRFPEKAKQQEREKAAREYAANPWYSNLWDAVSTPPEGK